MSRSLADALPTPGEAVRILYPSGHLMKGVLVDVVVDEHGHPTHLLIRRVEDDGTVTERVIQIAHTTAISRTLPGEPAMVLPGPRPPSPLDLARAARRPA